MRLCRSCHLRIQFLFILKSEFADLDVAVVLVALDPPEHVGAVPLEERQFEVVPPQALAEGPARPLPVPKVWVVSVGGW